MNDSSSTYERGFPYVFIILQKAPFDGTVYFSYCTSKYTTVVRKELFIKCGFLKNSIVSNFVYNIRSKNRVSWSSCQKLVKNKFLSMEQISSINLRHPRRHRGWLILIESHNWRFIAFFVIIITYSDIRLLLFFIMNNNLLS